MLQNTAPLYRPAFGRRAPAAAGRAANAPESRGPDASTAELRRRILQARTTPRLPFGLAVLGIGLALAGAA